MRNIEPAATKTRRTSIARERMRARLPRFNFARSAVAFDAPEMIGLGVAVLLMLLAVFSYFYSLAPARERLNQVQAALDDEQELLRASGQGLQEGSAGQVTVAEIVASLRNFEAENLPPGSEGQTAVVEELNEFIRRNNLRPDGGLSFTQIESDAARPSRSAASGRAANVFPGLGLTVGVEGTYPNVRRFIHDIETSRQFLVINGVELEGVRNAEGGGVNTLVSLNLNIAAYFRPIATPAGSVNDAAPQPSR